MKKTRNYIALIITLIMIVSFLPLNFVNAAITDPQNGDSQVIRTTTTNYFTTIQLNGTLKNENTGAELSYSKTSEEITGNIDSDAFILASEELTAGFFKWTTENGVAENNITFETAVVSEYYYDVHDEITQGNAVASGSDVIQVGDPENMDSAYLSQGPITINTILDKHQTAVITATATIPGNECKVLKGDNQKVNPTEKEKASFEFDIEYSKFLASGKVYVDNEEVGKENYDSSEGSTIITFNDEYTKALSVGKHTVRITVDDGYATADFTIVKTNNPKTGDEIVAYITIFVIATLAVAIIKKESK